VTVRVFKSYVPNSDPRCKVTALKEVYELQNFRFVMQLCSFKIKRWNIHVHNSYPFSQTNKQTNRQTNTNA